MQNRLLAGLNPRLLNTARARLAQSGLARISRISSRRIGTASPPTNVEKLVLDSIKGSAISSLTCA
jgi:hypothetical protein